jgi:hypothetical protein
MIKGFKFYFVPSVRKLVWTASKANTLVILHSCGTAAVGDKTVLLSNGYVMNSQEAITVRMEKDDELYAISDTACSLVVLVQEPK